LSDFTNPTRPFYVTGGTLKPGEPSYVERRADAELYESLLAGEFCYVLTARQMGKSSLMARTAKRLEEAGVCSAIVDLTQIGSERGTQAASQWYFGIANLIHRQLGITAPLRPWWQERDDLPPVQRLTDFFRELVLTHCPGRVVIFVDEIDSTIGLPFADDFFAALRACFNARATELAFERLTFVLLGVATPDQLIQDPARTPFNIGKRIDLNDFSPEEAQTLASGLHADPGEAEGRLERILYWTGGHPYLTQALCRAVRERARNNGTAEKAVDPQVEDLFLSSRAQREETNLKHARARLERPGAEGRRLLRLYRRVREGKLVPDQPTSPLFAQLKLAGVVKATAEGRLAVRNRIYETAFTPEWAKSAIPADRGRQLAAATVAVSLVGVMVWYAIFQPRPYEEAFQGAIQADAYNVAFNAYKRLYANPFSRPRSAELMQQFWEHRAMRYALVGKRDESLLSYLEALRWKDNKKLRKRAQNLVGLDYERLRLAHRHQVDVTDAAFSSGGQILATMSPDGVRAWEVIWGKQIFYLSGKRNTDAIPPRILTSITVSPDGHTLAAGSNYGTVGLWSTITGQTLKSFPTQRNGTIDALAFSPDGKVLATGTQSPGNFGGVQAWDVRTEKALTPLLQHSDTINALAFSPDGHILATASGGDLFAQYSTQIWDMRTGKLIGHPLQHEEMIGTLIFSRDGRTLATGSDDGEARLWDVFTGKPITSSLLHDEMVQSLAFSPSARILATGSYDGMARLWDTATGRPLAPPFSHNSGVAALAFSPDGQALATASNDGTIRFWDAAPGTSSTNYWQHETPVGVMDLSCDGRALTGSRDSTARLWNSVTGHRMLTPLIQLQRGLAIGAIAVSNDGRTLAVEHKDGAICLWNVATGKLIAPLLLQETFTSSAAFSPNGKFLATGSNDGTVRLWDAATGQKLAPSWQHSGVEIIVFSPDSRTLATGSAEGTVLLWDLDTGQSLTAPLLHGTSVTALAFSPDGRILLTGSEDGILRFKDATNGKALSPPVPIGGPVRTIVFNPNGKFFFVASNHWLNRYFWDGKKAIPLSSQLLHGLWTGGFRFSSECEGCLQVAFEDTGTSFHLETLHSDEPIDPPIKGDPKKLLEKWQSRLGLKFDEQMRLHPALVFPESFSEGTSTREDDRDR